MAPPTASGGRGKRGDARFCESGRSTAGRGGGKPSISFDQSDLVSSSGAAREHLARGVHCSEGSSTPSGGTPWGPRLRHSLGATGAALPGGKCFAAARHAFLSAS